MKIRSLLALPILVLALVHPGVAQRGPRLLDLVGTWNLVGLQRAGDGSGPTAVTNPRGMLVFDGAGHALEIGTSGGRVPIPVNQMTAADAQSTFASYGGFWGSYRVNSSEKTVAFKPSGAINPTLMGREVTRAYDVAGDRLTISALSGAPEEMGTRWVWERVPAAESLSPAQRRLVGFWEHVVEKRINADTNAIISETRRAPSIIVYTPAGYVGVHFPPMNRTPFAGDHPTGDEARAAITGYVGYYGIYLVYPGLVYHHQLASLNGNTTSFKRYFEIAGDELTLKFPPATIQGQMVRTVVTLKRLSGEADMPR
jgi:hypothetical protein